MEMPKRRANRCRAAGNPMRVRSFLKFTGRILPLKRAEMPRTTEVRSWRHDSLEKMQNEFRDAANTRLNGLRITSIRAVQFKSRSNTCGPALTSRLRLDVLKSLYLEGMLAKSSGFPLGRGIDLSLAERESCFMNSA